MSSGESSRSYAWPRAARLLKRTDFLNVYSKGSRHSNPLFTAFLLRSRLPVSRVGFTTPRALGKATERNRIRRRLREAVRLHYRELGRGWDVVFNPRRASRDAAFERLETEVARLFKTAAGNASLDDPAGSGSEPVREKAGEP